MSVTLVVNEIYLSLQGESTFAGLPCIFVRLTTCNLRCSYCDTAYAFKDGVPMELDSIHAHINELALPFTSQKSQSLRKTSIADLRVPLGFRRLPLVELTGGEPLLQSNSLALMTRLCDDDFTVLLETSGALDIAPVDKRVRRIMDLKCPSSGEFGRNRWENLPHLRVTDEIKFVIGSQEDYSWAKQQIRHYHLDQICPLLMSWVSPLTSGQQHTSLKPIPPGQTPITRQELADTIIADALPVRFQLQMHKFIWPMDQRGV